MTSVPGWQAPDPNPRLPWYLKALLIVVGAITIPTIALFVVTVFILLVNGW